MTASSITPPAEPPFDDELVDQLLGFQESRTFDVKRAGNNSRSVCTIVAFANTDGGVLVLGIEDPEKAKGRDRVYGIQENPESVDELRRLLVHRITPPLTEPDTPPPRFIEVGCTLRDRSRGSIMAVQVHKSGRVHSVVDGGTYVREDKSNRQIPAAEITDLSMRREAKSLLGAAVEADFDLLDTQTWRDYRDRRGLTRLIAEAMYHIGLARKGEAGKLLPTKAAVLLFAEEPSGLLDSKCSIRIFHYRGGQVEHRKDTNLLRPPQTISGPLISQIRRATEAVVQELASGVQVSPLGFEIVQRYPLRVIQETITNAVIHRAYHLNEDIHIRIFSDRIEVRSPGVLPGPVTLANLGDIGSRPRNRALVDHLREFPQPPNLDAGEGVRMMRQVMSQLNLYPPVFVTQPLIRDEAVTVFLRNEVQPGTWAQVRDYLQEHGTIGNAEVRTILKTGDPTIASRELRSWVELGLLAVANPGSGKKNRRYRLPESPPEASLFADHLSKEQRGGP